MIRAIPTAVMLAVFLLYSQSLLVMWCLYFVEKHDIVLYFCPEDIGSANPFAGARFVHELSDAQHGRAKGALMLLKIVERSIPYLPSTGTTENAIEGSRNSLFITETRKISDGYPSPPFIPPRGESAC